MKITHIFEKERGYVKVELSGNYDIEAFKIFYHKLLLDMGEKGINSILWDARKLDITNVSQDQIRSIISHVGRESQQRQGGKAAWVAEDELGFGMGRMFEMISEKRIDIRVQIFRDIQDAELWILDKGG